MKDFVRILGTEYKIIVRKYEEDPKFKELNCNGYCMSSTKTIVIGDLKTFEIGKVLTEEEIQAESRDILKHEIVHAFFGESGLKECSSATPSAWSEYEEMIDWIALQGEKIYEAWKEAGAAL